MTQNWIIVYDWYRQYKGNKEIVELLAAGTAGAGRTGSVQRRTGTVYGRAGGTIESGLGGLRNPAWCCEMAVGGVPRGLADGGGEAARITE